MKSERFSLVGKTIKSETNSLGRRTLVFTDGSKVVISASHSDPFAVGSADLHVRYIPAVKG